MAISGTFKHPIQTLSLFSFNMHLMHIPYVHYKYKRHLTCVIHHLLRAQKVLLEPSNQTPGPCNSNGIILFFQILYFQAHLMNCELSSLVSTIWDLIGSLNKPKNCPKPLKNTTLGTSKHPTQAKSIFNYFIYFQTLYSATLKFLCALRSTPYILALSAMQ